MLCILFQWATLARSCKGRAGAGLAGEREPEEKRSIAGGLWRYRGPLGPKHGKTKHGSFFWDGQLRTVEAIATRLEAIARCRPEYLPAGTPGHTDDSGGRFPIL